MNALPESTSIITLDAGRRGDRFQFFNRHACEHLQKGP